jgi:hypothetical protein
LSHFGAQQDREYYNDKLHAQAILLKRKNGPPLPAGKQFFLETFWAAAVELLSSMRNPARMATA